MAEDEVTRLTPGRIRLEGRGIVSEAPDAVMLVDARPDEAVEDETEDEQEPKGLDRGALQHGVDGGHDASSVPAGGGSKALLGEG